MTATLLPPGQLFGVRLRPARTGSATCLICSSVHFVGGSVGIRECRSSAYVSGHIAQKAAAALASHFGRTLPSNDVSFRIFSPLPECRNPRPNFTDSGKVGLSPAPRIWTRADRLFKSSCSNVPTLMRSRSIYQGQLVFVQLIRHFPLTTVLHHLADSRQCFPEDLAAAFMSRSRTLLISFSLDLTIIVQ